ncbi:DNA mismatch repair protein MutS [Polynucleobacter hirudinilacicola]|uniref:DNA mismatch repair protein MutS n=1 Tax=Polynucleobacter hirudinilacicola TaxID=1743166 RepID=A0A210RXH9_9BURK|nr:Smr/MutS family protein [Polynucleobacter hirudinilacicola]OWF65671.1 DNA mismatch repair protein MutS [Polynucleobacter hirudinilacicola]
MPSTAECPDCGNVRTLFNQCPHCGSDHLPVLTIDTIEINIKQGSPYVEEALDELTEQLRKCLELGIKAIILIHGYGSSGEGGRIKWAIHDALENNRYSDRVLEYFFGENVAYGSEAYQALLKRRPGLKRYLKRFKEGNAGMTVLLLGAYPGSA